ncbi:MAG: DUF3726 domain-containing protein [Nitratireductor sp.]|nr:DUF3726 domain-containing protein [Nitratireductor sp.]
MTHLSLNEIEAVSKRATRGAGRSWGMAEEAGKAVRILHEMGLPGGELLAGLLEATDNLSEAAIAPSSLDGHWHAASGVLCPVSTGATLGDIARDIAGGREIRTSEIAFPLLLLPFVMAVASENHLALRLEWSDTSLQVSTNGIGTDASPASLLAPVSESLACHITPETEAASAFGPPLHQMAQHAWEILNAFAARTYAPDSEASRLKGAGSSLPDND